MKKMLNIAVSKLIPLTLLILVTQLFVTSQIQAQGEWYLGAETVNRYIWRGVQFDNGVNIQPYLMYGTDQFEIGAASSTSLTNDFNEISFWTSYTIPTKAFDLKLYLGDFYYEYGGQNFMNFDGVKDGMAQGSHYVEGYVEISLANLPLSFLLSSVIWNDPDNSMYAQVSYHKTLANDIESAFTLGAALNESNTWYYTQKTGIVNVSYEISKEVKITESFSLPMNAKAILNPYNESFYVVFGISF